MDLAFGIGPGESVFAAEATEFDCAIGTGFEIGFRFPFVVDEIVQMFNMQGLKTQVLAASFKTCEQVHKVAMVGAHSVTINPELFSTLIYHPLTMYAIDAFDSDWSMVYGDKKAGDILAD